MSQSQIEIRLVTKQNINAVPDNPLTVPDLTDTQTLNKLVNELLKENDDLVKPLDFDFLISGELLRLPLATFLENRKISTEVPIEVEYIERTPAPQPQDSLLHDDWVSSVATNDKWILTGCYDNSVNIWTSHGEIVLKLQEHQNIVKSVTWIKKGDPSEGFISVSHDCSGIIWSWDEGTDKATAVAHLRGHEQAIDCVCVSPNSSKVVTGGWDQYLKIWSLSHDPEPGESLKKKIKGHNVMIKTPLNTLKGHKDAVSSIDWIDNSTFCSVSMDHTIKFWDADLCGIKNEIIGQKAFLDCSWSPLSNMLLATSYDKHIRLYDSKSSDCKATFTSHTNWVSCVKWSPYDEHLFVTAGYDSMVKLWDTRSPEAPLYDLKGHVGSVFALDWSTGKYIVSGGKDNSVHIFKN